MIWIIIAMVILFLVGSYFVERYIAKLRRSVASTPKPKLKELPVFTTGPRCARCSGPVETDDVSVSMVVTLLYGKQLPVTVRLCESCVANA